MKTIWKYPLTPPDVGDEVEIEMPQGAQILDVQVQAGTPCLWALVDPSAPKRWETFRIVGTGHVINGPIVEYVATFQVEQLVFHVFYNGQRN